MPLSLAKTTARLTGAVGVEEAGQLADWLRATPGASVNLAGCEHLHTAALQALLAARPRVSRPATDAFLATWIMPLLAHPGRPTAKENP
jgi:hypothetical protein